MAVLQWGLLLLVIAFLVHLALWRIHKPASPFKALLVIFVAVIVLGLSAAYFGEGVIRSAGLAVLPNAAAYLHVLLFSLSMALAYVVAYSLLEWDSPSLAIITRLAKAGRDGMAEGDLQEFVENLPFMASRIDCLIRDGSLVHREGRYVVAPGRHLAYRLILFYRRLLGAERQGG